MNYNLNENEMQIFLNTNDKFLMIPSSLNGFINNETVTGITKSGRTIFDIRGSLEITAHDRKMHYLWK